MANELTGLGLCESKPEKTAWPSREETDKTVDMYRACGIAAWPERCRSCNGWHIILQGDKTK